MRTPKKKTRNLETTTLVLGEKIWIWLSSPGPVQIAMPKCAMHLTIGYLMFPYQESSKMFWGRYLIIGHLDP